MKVRKLRDENPANFREALGQRYQFENIIGHSPEMRGEIFATITRVAGTRATVLLAGESGVGKDMAIARAIHQHSRAATGRS